MANAYSLIRAKIDTGAYSSALDVAEYHLVGSEQEPRVVLRLRLSRKSARSKTIEVPVTGFVWVRSSTGTRQRRPLIEPVVQLGQEVRRIRLTLSDRATMRSRMLLGRQALSGLFVVDVRFKDLLVRDDRPHSR